MQAIDGSESFRKDSTPIAFVYGEGGDGLLDAEIDRHMYIFIEREID